jgi:hypothetical protein
MQIGFTVHPERIAADDVDERPSYGSTAPRAYVIKVAPFRPVLTGSSTSNQFEPPCGFSTLARRDRKDVPFPAVHQSLFFKSYIRISATPDVFYLKTGRL